MNSYYDLPENIRIEIIELLSDFNISDLYKKAAYDKNIQKIILTGENVNLTIYQDRLYQNRLSYKTNCTGDISLVINYDNQEINYKYDDLLYIISWVDTNYNYRLIVPSEIISNSDVIPFISAVISHKNTIISTDFEQIIYFNSLDGAESLVSKYNLIIENKPEGGQE